MAKNETPGQAELAVVERIRDIPRADWNALVGPEDSPFVDWDWLCAMEESKSAARNTGWAPAILKTSRWWKSDFWNFEFGI